MFRAGGEDMMSANAVSFLRTQVSVSFLSGSHQHIHSGRLVNREGAPVVWLVSSFHLGRLSQLLLLARLQRARQFALATAASC